MESIENNGNNFLPNSTQFFYALWEVKSNFEWVMKIENIKKINDNLYEVEIDWLKYYVSYITRKYNFDSGYDKENKFVMDASVIMWVVDVDKSTKSSWVVFVSSDNNVTYLQFAYYDSEVDKVLINWYNNNLEIAFNAVEKYKWVE